MPAAAAHLAPVRELVARAGLPTDGIEQQFPAAFVVAEQAGELVGVAGLERYGAAGLLRSVVVAEQCRQHGLGRLLVRDRLEAAVAGEFDRVFLLTTTAARYFERLGFVATPRSAAPPLLAASAEFARACPASATCLVYEMPGPGV